MELLTIFTPTYNRAYLLPQLYESLCRQSDKGFVWLIVDDGSSDNTDELVRSWIVEKRIKITYKRQSNGGKMRAHNLGARLCTTPLFVCVDSDDYITDNCVEAINKYYPKIMEENKVAGIISYKSIKGIDGDFQIKRRFPIKGLSTLGDLQEHGFREETTLVFKTDILQRFPFLEVEGEKFSAEDYAYDQIEQEYKFLLVDEAWTLCTYMPDGYSQAERNLYKNNPKGWALYFNQKAKFTHTYLSKQKIACGIMYMIFARRGGFKNIYQLSELKTPLYPVFWLLSYLYEWKWREKFPK